MILDLLTHADPYAAMHPGLRAAFDYLRTTDLTTIPAGRHALDGERLALIIETKPGRGHDGAKLEAHRRYIDIQIPLAGPDEMGYIPTAKCSQVKQAYDPAKDIEFFADTVETWLNVQVGQFVVFFPQDAHAPLAGPADTQNHKAIFKIAVNW